MSDQFVYFIKPVGMDGPIKIGCSNKPERRLLGLMCWSPVDLEILATVEGGLKLESKVHRAFADLHRRNEWFEPGERLLDAIAKLQSGAPIEVAVSFSDDFGRIKKRPDWSPEVRKRMSYLTKVRFAVKRAQKATGKNIHEPVDIDGILGRWRGSYGYWDDKRDPTAAEMARLEQFIADPVTHCISYEAKRLWRAAA